MKKTVITDDLIVFSDGFVWKRLSRKVAEALWNSVWYWIQPVTNGRSIAIRMIYWLLDVTGSHIARWRVLRDN